MVVFLCVGEPGDGDESRKVRVRERGTATEKVRDNQGGLGENLVLP